MTYRVSKKTTKKTVNKCKECKFVLDNGESLVECTAPNKCFMGKSDARYFYCLEYEGFNELSFSKIEKLKNKILDKQDEVNYKEYVRKYHPKKEAKRLIEEYKSAKRGTAND